MKHDFSNLNTGAKNKVFAGQGTCDDVVFDDDVEAYWVSSKNTKEMCNTFKSKQRNLGAAIVGAQDYVFLSEDGEKLEDLIDDLLSTDDLPDLGKSKVWKDLLALLEDGYASKLRKEQKELDHALSKLQASVKTSLDITKELYKKIS